MLGVRDDVTGFVERLARDSVASPGAFVVYLYRGRLLQCVERFLASADVHLL